MNQSILLIVIVAALVMMTVVTTLAILVMVKMMNHTFNRAVDALLDDPEFRKEAAHEFSSTEHRN